MSECLPDMPRFIRQNGDEWQGAEHIDGPWRPIATPQSGLPLPVPSLDKESPVTQPTDAVRAALAQAEGNDIPAGPLSEQDLCQQWNAQADKFNQWNSLESSEQLAWAQSRAVAVDRKRRVTPPGLPPNYIDPEHTDQDRELLEVFYEACQSEGGTTDEINLRGICAVLAARSVSPSAPEAGIDPNLQDTITWLLEEAESAVADDCPVAAGRLTRAATLLQQLTPASAVVVVPVSERPWEREGWCDTDGRCWLCSAYSMGRWNYNTPPDPAQDWGRLGTVTHSAPHWAIPRPLPVPKPQAGEAGG